MYLKITCRIFRCVLLVKSPFCDEIPLLMGHTHLVRHVGGRLVGGHAPVRRHARTARKWRRPFPGNGSNRRIHPGV